MYLGIFDSILDSRQDFLPRYREKPAYSYASLSYPNRFFVVITPAELAFRTLKRSGGTFSENYAEHLIPVSFVFLNTKRLKIRV